MRAQEVLRYSGVISLAQLAMRSDPDPSETLQEIADLQREGMVAIQPRPDPSVLEDIASTLERKSPRDQLRELQRESIADAKVELLGLPGAR
jgi:hypothetical protein